MIFMSGFILFLEILEFKETSYCFSRDFIAIVEGFFTINDK